MLKFQDGVVSSLRRWLPAAGLILLPSLIALALYGPELGLPYYWDDFPHFNFVTTRSYASLWTSAIGLPYYRPLTFTIDKLLFTNLPFGASWLPHLCVVLGHVLASILAGYVAGVLWVGPDRAAKAGQAGRRAAVAVITAGLFAAFPFATQSAAYLGAATHIWLADLTLGGLAALLHYARSGNRAFAGLALAAALAAPTAHEAGVVAGPLMVAGLWMYDRAFARRHLWLLVALAAASALFLPIWLRVPKSRDANAPAWALGDAPEILAKLSFFLQAPSYPFQPLAALLISRLNAWDLGAIWLCGLPPLAAAGAWLWRRGQGRVVGFTTAWTALAMLPSVFALRFDYISISQRLLYYPGLAAAILWGVVLVEAASAGQGRWRRLAALVATGGLAVAALGIPSVYAVRQARLNVLALSPLRQLDDAARQYPGDRHLIINTVNWMSYRQIWYPLGHDGLSVLAPYVSLTDLIYINTGIRLDATVATFPDLLPTFENHFISTANEAASELWNTAAFSAHIAGMDHTWFTSYTDTQAMVSDVGHVSAAGALPPPRFLGRFENSVYLVNGSFRVEGSRLIMTLDWLYRGPDPQATIFRNAFDCLGNIVGLGSGQALGAMLPFGGLPGGTLVHDVRAIDLEARSADGCYQVEVGLFRSDGSRLEAFGPDGGALANQLVLVR